MLRSSQKIPEYFSAYVKQYGNIISIERAENIARVVSESLDAVLPHDSAKLFFYYAPHFLTPQKPMFYVNKTKSHHAYSQDILYSRMKIALKLTDDTEVKQLLHAYFQALSVVVGTKGFRNITTILPQPLQMIL